MLNLGEPLTKNEFEEFLSITGVEIDREGMIKYERITYFGYLTLNHDIFSTGHKSYGWLNPRQE